MAGRYDKDEVRARTDIVSVVEKYVTLKRSGNRLKGLCPFHQEKTPSFQVSPDLGTWYCFGQCGEGGDVFKFVQKIENLSFPEALERLALQAGVAPAPTSFPSNAEGRASEPSGHAYPDAGERDRLYQVNALALDFYRQRLGLAAEAREYLQQRDLSHAMQQAFGIGFAPDDWEGLTGFLGRKGVSLIDAEKAGLVSKNERGGYFDKLRGRLIFPIFDVQERPVAFGGRLLGEARPGQPKYWNSPETPVFSKSKTLYGLWRARKAISAKSQAIVVEGYTDVIAAHQAGFENVVATLGTSLTEEHVRTLARFAPTVLLAFDADSAGLKAAFRAAEMFEAQDIEVRVLDLPEGEDPDSLLRSGKRAVFEQAITHALPLVEYRLRRLIRKGQTETERDRIALFRKALPILASVPSTIEREQYVRMLAPYHPHYAAGTVHAEDHIRQDVAAYGQAGHATPWRNGGQSAPSPRPVAPAHLPGGATEQAERQLLRALVSGDAALVQQVRARIAPAEFATDSGRALAAEIYRLYEQTPDLSAGQLLSAVADDAQRDALTALLMAQDGEPLTPSLLDGEIAHLKRRAVEQERLQVKERIDAGQADTADRQRYVRLSSQLKQTPSAPSLAGR